MPVTLRLDAYDHEFRPHSPADEWRRILAVRDHPDFLRGVEHYNTEIPQYFAGSLPLNKVGSQLTRLLILVLTLHLDDTADADAPASGLTLSRLQALCRTHKLASASGVASFLGLMLLARFLTAHRSKRDGRTVHLVPTAEFLDKVYRWTGIVIAAVDAIEPDGQLAAAQAALPRFTRDFHQDCAQTLIAGWQPVAPFPEVAHFLAVHGGWMLMTTCMAETMRAGGGQSIVPVSIDLAAHARRFSGSRTNLRRLLEGAHAKGLLDAAPQNGRHVLLSARLVSSWLTAQASELAVYRHAGLAARDALVRRRTPSTTNATVRGASA